MAYSGIVGVQPIMGLYTLIPPLIVYALLGTSRVLVAGPDTATGLIFALTVGAVAAQGTATFNTYTFTLAISIGVFSSSSARCAWAGWLPSSPRR
jgi:MFS superfamily sulfate permease-like transporter